MIETFTLVATRTPFLRVSDMMRIDMKGADCCSIFEAMEQSVEKYSSKV